MEGMALARRSVETASEKQASDIVLVDARGVCSFTDYLMLCTAESQRQLRTIYEEIEKDLKKAGAAHRREGTPDSGWILLDCGDVIIHIFSTEERERYRLDELMAGAKLILRMQ
ncbi:MAG: ribosome silencing factor [Chloroflexi bacterium]|nr:ribosome silencing factor [Chloroflexota bacterium]